MYAVRALVPLLLRHRPSGAAPALTVLLRARHLVHTLLLRDTSAVTRARHDGLAPLL